VELLVGAAGAKADADAARTIMAAADFMVGLICYDEIEVDS
jgi:hypothetical protein